MQRLIDVATRKTMNAMFDAGLTGVASVGFVVIMIILRSFRVI